MTLDKGRKDGDRREIANVILGSIPRDEFRQLSSSLEFVRLKSHQVLHEAGETIRSGYFLSTGLGSVLTVQPEGNTFEAGLIGKEGFIGLPVIFGFKTSGLRMVTQAEDATAYRVDTDTLLRILPRCPELKKQLERFSMILGMQFAQLAVCNQLHGAVERLVRRLLMSHDRIGGTTLLCTQNFLAQMLGMRRATITLAAGTLQEKELIRYSRGRVSILNREKLEEMACDCYQVIERQKTKWQAETAK